MMQSETNRGTGAGGSNTNVSGLRFEDITDLSSEFNKSIQGVDSYVIEFNGNGRQYNYAKKAGFLRHMGDKVNKDVKSLHGAKQPDEVYVDHSNGNIFIIEKKNQNTSGSKCECIQTAVSKKRNYSRRIPTYNVVYIYCLSSWFKDNCQAELDDLEEDNIPVFWGNDENYKRDIIEFIINYK